MSRRGFQAKVVSLSRLVPNEKNDACWAICRRQRGAWQFAHRAEQEFDLHAMLDP